MGFLVFWTARKQHDPSYLKPGNGITHHFAAEIPQQSDTYSDTFEPLRCCVAFFPGWLGDLAVFASWNPEWNSLNSPKNTILSEKRNLLNTLMFFHIWRPFKGGIAQVEPWFLKIAQVVFVGQHIGDPLIPLLLKKHTQVWVFKVAVLIKCYPSENARFRMFWSQWEWGDINPDTHGNGKKDWGLLRMKKKRNGSLQGGCSLQDIDCIVHHILQLIGHTWGCLKSARCPLQTSILGTMAAILLVNGW